MKYKRFFAIFILFMLICSNKAYAITIDNDGKPRENPYGDSKLPSSYEGVKYYDCYIPYSLTNEEVGGYATACSSASCQTYNVPMTNTDKKRKVGTKVNTEGDHSHKQLNIFESQGHCKRNYEDSSLVYYTDKNGNKYYVSATQYFFSNNDNWSGKNLWGYSCVGQLYDMILTDGTVIHCIKGDDNAKTHTNGTKNNENPAFDVIYTVNKLNYPQYRYLFQAQAGNCIELWMRNNTEGTSHFKNKYKLGDGENDVKVAYYRVYDLMINENPKRADGVGTDVSYSLGDVNINSSQENSGGVASSDNILVPESWLVGMPDDSKISDEASGITLASLEEMSASERKNLNIIKEESKFDLIDTMVSFLRILIVFTGMILIFYPILLGVSYIFDKSNNFLDISMIRIVSLGKLHCCFEDEVEEKGGINTKRLVKISIVCIFVGGILVSGGVYFFISFLQKLAIRGYSIVF